MAMEDQEFIAKLSQLAEWHRPQIGPNGQPSQSKRIKFLEKIYQEQEAEEDEDSDLDPEEELAEDPEDPEDQKPKRKYQPPKFNPNIPPEIKTVKHTPLPCEDCGRICEGRRVEHRLLISPERHWRSRCDACGLTKDPNTGKYDLKYNRNIQDAYKKFFNRKSKG